MNVTTVRAFSDELEKIALAKTAVWLPSTGTIARSAVRAVTTGSRSYGRGIAKNLGNTMEASMSPVKSFKKGLTESGNWMGRGKLTKNLPVGGMSMTAAGAVLGAPEAFSKQDPTGQGRSRLERVSRWTGNNVGGVIGTPHGMTGAFAGSIGGDIVGGVAGRIADKARGYKPTSRFTPGVSE